MSEQNITGEEQIEFYQKAEIGNKEWVFKINEFYRSGNNIEELLNNINSKKQVMSLLKTRDLDFDIRLMLLEKLDENSLMPFLHANSVDNSTGQIYFNFIKSERLSEIIIFSLLKLGEKFYLPLILKLIKNIKDTNILNKILNFKEANSADLLKFKIPKVLKESSESIYEDSCLEVPAYDSEGDLLLGALNDLNPKSYNLREDVEKYYLI